MVRYSALSATPAARASRIAPARALFSRGSYFWGAGWVLWAIAFITAVRHRWLVREPVTSEATFCSSSTFQLTNASMSGWSRSRQTIFAARRVVPPLLIAPAARSPILRKLISPDDLPPPESGSFSPRRREKLEPVPEPYLNRRDRKSTRL